MAICQITVRLPCNCCVRIPVYMPFLSKDLWQTKAHHRDGKTRTFGRPGWHTASGLGGVSKECWQDNHDKSTAHHVLTRAALRTTRTRPDLAWARWRGN